MTWQPIETAPEGNEDDGPFFDVTWAGKMHRYLPVPYRLTDCYMRNGRVFRLHGYPSMTTAFVEQPTHWMPNPGPAAIAANGASQ